MIYKAKCQVFRHYTYLQCYELTRAVLVYMQGEAVILAELGEYTREASLLEDIIKVST